jgi:nitroreductase
MEEKAIHVLSKIISDRHTTKVNFMNGNKIPDDQVLQLIKLADFAPTHGRTEPWRFIIYKGSALDKFAKDHGTLYWENTPPDKRLAEKKRNLEYVGEKASHLVIVYMKRTAHTKIPRDEEYAATAAAVQNILLGAEAMGLAAIWNTGGMALHESMKQYLQLESEDTIVAFLYLGYSSEQQARLTRRIPIAQKVEWK